MIFFGVFFIYRIIGFFTRSKVLEEWLGDGAIPVPQQEANQRALICETCPNNKPVNGLTTAAAKTIEKWVAIKNRRKLFVPNEDKLFFCHACLCKLSLKVHVPHVHIKSYQQQWVTDRIRETKSDCWQL
jgi:hypothetical protein